MNQCKICGCDYGHTGDCPFEDKHTVAEKRLRAECAALSRQLAAVTAERDRLLNEREQADQWARRAQDRLDCFERSRICHSPYAKRPILYTDTVDGEQCCVDNLWAVSTQELNEMKAERDAAVAQLDAVRLWAAGNLDDVGNDIDQEAEKW